MALRIIGGVPGAGKTYYMVRHLVKTYFHLDGEEYIMNKEAPVQLVSNIDGLVLPHLNFDELLEAHGGLDNFFSKAFQAEFQKGKHPLVYLIDEAVDYFPKSMVKKLEKAFQFLRWHRHEGIDIYMATQDVSLLPDEVKKLPEYIIQGTARIRSLAGEMKYNLTSKGDVLKTECFPYSKTIGKLYKSAKVAESEKIRNPIVKTIIIALVIFVVIGCFGFYRLFRYFSPPAPVASSSASISKSSGQIEYNPPPGPGVKKSVTYMVQLSYIASSDKLIYLVGDELIPAAAMPWKVLIVQGHHYALVTDSVFKETWGDKDIPRISVN